ncbi:Flagellar hook-associated protein FlgK [hydrothermal vent metagenome]|uniref:Flagellar hook-associated protein FlgK n=1 Tax=hydrothermal vent metagenome TaxID=652676 RepID=A0A1W1D331_9ZZZZ
MGSLLNTLGIGYSGLNASQVGIDTTGHNITNAEVDGYNRQRVITSAATPISSGPGQVGNGTHVDNIKRVFDNYVFDRYKSVSAQKEYSDYEQKQLEQLSSYFPEIDNVGIKEELSQYYNKWQNLADNPDNDAIKMDLAKQTESLTNHISHTQDQIKTLQKTINEDIVTNVNEVNSLAKELASINMSIETAESADGYSANDLRDRRNQIEKDLSRLIGAKVTSSKIESNIEVDGSSNTRTGNYTLSVAGFNLVDGSNFHPIDVSNAKNANGFYDLSYERQDGVKFPISSKIKGGKIGAMLDLRGGTITNTTGVPNDGTIQKTIAQLDAFSKGLIESTNNIYAQTPVQKMQSNVVDMNENDSIFHSSLNVKEGSFDLVVYDLDGNVAASRTINIDDATVMKGRDNPNSIEAQIFAQKDDNSDNNANDDIDDFFQNGFNFTPSQTGELRLELALNPLAQSRGYTFAIKDNLKDGSFDSGTNFAGALGLNRYFDGNDAQSIRLHNRILDNPTLISASASPSTGDSSLALDMVQHQFEKYDFDVAGEKYNTTTYGMFDLTATEVGTATNMAISKNDTVSAQFNASEMEYASVSKVSIDEEMANLVRYQTAYSASAKIITTINQMTETLLGIKQ